MAEQSTRPRFGLALGSGGARGWCHIGVLQELEVMGLRPDMVAGSSMGALVAAAWASGRLTELEDFARSLTRRRVFSYLDIRFGRGGLIAGGGIEGMLARIGMASAIGDLPIPFIAVAADLGSGREIWLREGSLIDAVRASISMPGVIAPKLINGQWLLDGGVVNPVPVSAVRALGAEMVLAVNPNARHGEAFWRPEPARPSRFSGFIPSTSMFRSAATPPAETPLAPPPWMHLVTSTIDMMADTIRRSRLAADAPDLLLAARLRDITVLDFHKAEAAIEEGRRITRAHADILTSWIG